MTRLPLILAHEALRRLTRRVGRLAGVPYDATLSARWGRWYVHEPQRDPTRYGTAVWPEDDGNGGARSEDFDGLARGAVFTVLTAAYYDGGNSVVVTLTRDEVTGEGADVLRRQRAEDEARWWRENGGGE